MKTISTNFDTNRIVTMMLSRQTHRPITAPQNRQGRGRRRDKDMPANRHPETSAQVKLGNRQHKPR